MSAAVYKWVLIGLGIVLLIHSFRFCFYYCGSIELKCFLEYHDGSGMVFTLDTNTKQYSKKTMIHCIIC